MFRWYREHWKLPYETQWKEFVARWDAEFRGRFPGNRLAPPSSRLASNLQYVFSALGDSGRAIEDILLYFHPKGSTAALPLVEPSSFRLVPFPYEPADNAAFIRMTA